MRIMEEKLRAYMDELETSSMWDCKQIYDWMFGAIDFARRIGLIEEQAENVLKEEDVYKRQALSSLICFSLSRNS